MHDVEDRPHWYASGERNERLFVQMCHEEIPNLDIDWNSAKKENKLLPDLLYEGRPAEFKGLFTPFFRAYAQYRIPSEDCFTMGSRGYSNLLGYKDVEYIFIWKQFRQESKLGYSIKGNEGWVYRVRISELIPLVESDRTKTHWHNNRGGEGDRNDPANYPLNLMNPPFEIVHRCIKFYPEVYL